MQIVLNEEAYLSEQIGNNIKAVRLLFRLNAGCRNQASMYKLENAAEWKVLEAKYILLKLCFTLPAKNNIQSAWLFYRIYTDKIWNKVTVSQNYSNSRARNTCMETRQLECKAGWRLIWGKMKEINAFSEEDENKKAFYDL